MRYACTSLIWRKVNNHSSGASQKKELKAFPLAAYQSCIVHRQVVERLATCVASHVCYSEGGEINFPED